MNKRTKLFIGIALIVSAITTLFTFISLCFKKKSAIAALAALAAAEGLVGLALIEDNKGRFRKKSVATDAELFEGDAVEFAEATVGAELSDLDDENSSAPRIDFEVPKDEDASEDDFT
ncbi:MAG: hypothetical protein IJW79_10265 [Clostridia bacterium]|nr:hypothetical protein [Clostridia bacterium]